MEGDNDSFEEEHIYFPQEIVGYWLVGEKH